MIDVRITRFEHRNKISGVFQFEGHWYLADLVELPFGLDIYETPYEFMVFKSDEHGKVTDWSGEFVLRPDAVSEEILLQCIEEFCAFQEES
jgi:hypothetical protein